MPEIPDFDQIAKAHVSPMYVPMVVEQLRQVWNARGAADIAALEPTLGVNMETEIRAVKKLDR